jgi:hypothetical protein
VELIGTIEPDAGVATGRAEWLQAIEAHPQLSRGSAKAKAGINPFTGEPMLYRPHPNADATSVMIDDSKVGSIHWAMDDSRFLVVWSKAGADEKVIGVAMDVAARLGWHFVRSTAVRG